AHGTRPRGGHDEPARRRRRDATDHVRLRVGPPPQMTRPRTMLAAAGALLAMLVAATPALADYTYDGSFGHPGGGPGGFGPPRADYRLYRLKTSPGAIAFDARGNLWVSDSLNARVQRFSPSGRYLGGFGR